MGLIKFGMVDGVHLSVFKKQLSIQDVKFFVTTTDLIGWNNYSACCISHSTWLLWKEAAGKRCVCVCVYMSVYVHVFHYSIFTTKH